MVKTFLPDNPSIIEAGSHYGEDTEKMASLWPNRTIYAFVPFPHSFNLTQEKAKKFSNVLCYQYALGNKNEIVVATSGDGASSLLNPNSILDPYIAFDQKPIKVESIILDTWAKNNNVTKIDFMWLDMEGYELAALKASPEIGSTVKAIYTEVNFQEFREGNCFYDEIKQWLGQQGFKEEWTRFWSVDSMSWQGNVLFVCQ